MTEPTTENDLRYDTAGLRMYGANVIAFWKELRNGGMDRREALAVVLELVRAQVANYKADS